MYIFNFFFLLALIKKKIGENRGMRKYPDARINGLVYCILQCMSLELKYDSFEDTVLKSLFLI